jgi:NADH-quinone oxidoreductase subunit N
MFLLTNSYNIISLFLSLELQSFCFYILASYKRDSIYSTEAGLKYFLLGGFSTAVVLFGSSLLYGFTGTINFQELTLLSYSNWYSNFVISLSTLFILTGFLFKLGAFPFHAWVPDVYEGSPTSTSIFFAVSSKAALIVVASRFLVINCNTSLFDWQSVLLICGIFSIFVGSFLAVKQKKIKRLLAYSSISHIGYLLLAMVTITIEGFYSVFLYLFVYMLAVLCVWCVVLNIQNSLCFLRSINLSDLGAIFNFNNSLALTFLLAIFSMSGVPPLVGFYAKLSVFFSITNSNFFFVVTVCFLITVISTFFYVRLVKISFFEKILQVSLFENPSYVQANILAINSFLLVFLFFNTSLLDVLSYRLALSL